MTAQVTTKKRKRTKHLIMPRKSQQSKQLTRDVSETSQTSTDETVSFNPPISSTMYTAADLASTKAGKRPAKEHAALKFESSESESEFSDDPNTTMDRLLGGALSRLSRYQRLLSKGHAGKYSQAEDTAQTDTSIEEEQASKAKRSKLKSISEYTVKSKNKSVATKSISKSQSDQSTTAQKSAHSSHKDESVHEDESVTVDSSSPSKDSILSLSLDDATPPTPEDAMPPTLEDATPPTPGGATPPPLDSTLSEENAATVENTPKTEQSVLRVKRFSIMLTKMSPKEAKKMPIRKSIRTGKGPPKSELSKVGINYRPSNEDVLACASPDVSVLPVLIRKRKKPSTISLPSKQRKLVPQEGDSDDGDVTISPGGREYRRYRVEAGGPKTPGMRRSNRTKIAPARPWLGEKIDYDMRRKSGIICLRLLIRSHNF